MLKKINAATFKFNMTNHSQDIPTKQIQLKLRVPAHKQSLLRNNT